VVVEVVVEEVVGSDLFPAPENRRRSMVVGAVSKETHNSKETSR